MGGGRSPGCSGDARITDLFPVAGNTTGAYSGGEFVMPGGQQEPIMREPGVAIGYLPWRILMKHASLLSTLKLGPVWFTAIGVLVIALAMPAQERNVEDFFRDFAADWVRHDPDLATRTRYLSGEEQHQLERELTPQTTAWRRERI